MSKHDRTSAAVAGRGAETAAPALSEAQEPVIEYPRPGDRLEPGDYTFRVSCAAEGEVHVSVDREPWRPCRHSVGYWWYDWTVLQPGAHSALVRVKTPDGRYRQGREVSFRSIAPR